MKFRALIWLSWLLKFFHVLCVISNHFSFHIFPLQLHSDPLKLSADTDMQDWFLERDSKMSQVILHDKLISDALIGTLPIKTEHSYSLNSDGDSMPDSPRSLHTKIEGKLTGLSFNKKPFYPHPFNVLIASTPQTQ